MDDSQKESYNGHEGDSININPNYPFGGPLQILGELLDMIKNKDSVKGHFESHQLDHFRTNYILYYNPYSPANDGSFGFFDYFNSLEEARSYLKKCRPNHNLEDYFTREESKIFYSFHAYCVEWDEKNKPIENIQLRLLRKHDLPSYKTLQKSQKLDKISKQKIKEANTSIEILDVEQVKEIVNETQKNTWSGYLAVRGTPFFEADEVVKLIDVNEPLPPKQPFSTKYDHLGPLYDKVLSYNGPKVQVHKLTGALEYFDLYQNFLAQWDTREDIEKNIKLVTDYLTGDASLTKFLENVEKLYQYFRNLVLDRSHHHAEKIKELEQTKSNSNFTFTLEQLKRQLETWKHNSFRKLVSKVKFKNGDLLDLEGYLGTGLFLIHYDQVTNKFLVLPTLGDRGHILPEPGFNLIKEFGLEYFMDSEVSGFQISHLRHVQIRDKESGDYVVKSLDQPMYLEASSHMEMDDEMDEVIIDGKYLFGYLTKYYT